MSSAEKPVCINLNWFDGKMVAHFNVINNEMCDGFRLIWKEKEQLVATARLFDCVLELSKCDSSWLLTCSHVIVAIKRHGIYGLLFMRLAWVINGVE